MLNPLEFPDLMEFDSVFMIKNMIKHFYQRKGHLNEKLAKKLDALVIERPEQLEAKKQEFFSSYETHSQKLVKKIRIVTDEIEKIRMQAELKRV